MWACLESRLLFRKVLRRVRERWFGHERLLFHGLASNVFGIVDLLPLAGRLIFLDASRWRKFSEARAFLIASANRRGVRRHATRLNCVRTCDSLTADRFTRTARRSFRGTRRSR